MEARGDGAEGACHDALIFSILRAPNGASSTLILSRSGETGKELSGAEAFDAWSLMAKYLSDKPGVPAEERKIAQGAFEAVRRLRLRDRGRPLG